MMQLYKVLNKLNIELNQDTTPADIMRQAAKGEIVLTIESDSGEHETTPTASFWAQVRKDNADDIPKSKIYDVRKTRGHRWINGDLSITPDALAKLSADDQQRKDDLFSRPSLQHNDPLKFAIYQIRGRFISRLTLDHKTLTRLRFGMMT